MPPQALGRLLLALGAVAIIAGAALVLLGRSGWSGRLLPGDVYLQRPGFTLWFPVVTCIALSVVLSLIMWLLGTLLRR